jgi:pimeloyl-ACP methyl ester carboxylesterase
VRVGYPINAARKPAVARAQRALLTQFGTHAIPSQVLARITAPTTLIWGRHATIVPLVVGAAASDRYRWPLHVIEAGNEPAREAPEAFLRAAFETTKGSS